MAYKGFLDIFTDVDKLEGIEESEYIELKFNEYEIKRQELKGYTFIPIYKLTSGKWEGWFIVEVYQSYPHPIVLVPPHEIEERKH